MYKNTKPYTRAVEDICLFLLSEKISPKTDILGKALLKMAGLNHITLDDSPTLYERRLIVTIDHDILSAMQLKSYLSKYLTKFAARGHDDRITFVIDLLEFHEKLFPFLKENIRFDIKQKDEVLLRYQQQSLKDETFQHYQALLQLLMFIPKLQSADPDIFSDYVVNEYLEAICFLEDHRQELVAEPHEAEVLLNKAQALTDLEDKVIAVKNPSLRNKYFKKCESYTNLLFEAPTVLNLSLFKMAKQQLAHKQDVVPPAPPPSPCR